MTVAYDENDTYNGSGEGGNGVQSVVAGSNVVVNSTDPQNPIINAIVPPGQNAFGFVSINLAACRQALAVPGVNNAGALLATFFQAPTNFSASQLSCFVKQAASGGLTTLCIYDQYGTLKAKTASFFANQIGLKTEPIAFDGNNQPLGSFDFDLGVGYYLAIHCTQNANGSQYFAYDAGTTFGPNPWIGWVRDNVSTPPNPIGGGSESSIRFYVGVIN